MFHANFFHPPLLYLKFEGVTIALKLLKLCVRRAAYTAGLIAHVINVEIAQNNLHEYDHNASTLHRTDRQTDRRSDDIRWHYPLVQYRPTQLSTCSRAWCM